MRFVAVSLMFVNLVDHPCFTLSTLFVKSFLSDRSLLLASVFHCCITTNDEEKGRQAAQFLAEQMLSRQMQRLVMLVDKNTAAGAQQCVRALITALHGDYPRIQVLEQLEINDHYSAEDFEKL